MNYSKQDVLAALSHVDDPDLHRDIVSLGMVQELQLSQEQVSFQLVLTTPACPFKDTLQLACTNAIHHYIDPNLRVEILFTSRVTTQRTANEQVLEGVKNIVAVASGKGGVGKSTVAANMAIAMAATGAKVGLLDADIYGPSQPVLLGLRNLKPEVHEREGKLIIEPFSIHNIKTMSIGVLIAEHQALAWRGPMITTALRQLMTDVAWGELDYLFIDMPPGTGDIYLTLAQQFPLTAAVIVTSPHQVSVYDTRKSMELFRMPAINVPILGIVENMAWFSPEDQPERRYYVFGKGGADELAQQYNVPVLAQIPVIAAADDNTGGAISKLSEPIKSLYAALAGKVASEIATINNVGPPTQASR